MQKLSSILKKIKNKFDPYYLSILLVPFSIILILAILFLVLPEGSLLVVESIREFLTQELGIWYLLVGIAVVIVALYLAFSKIGKIKLGKDTDKPMKTLTWGGLIFTSTMAADILFYALHEWTYYYNLGGESVDASITSGMSYSLFHWGIIPWLFYLVPAAAYAFMFYVRKRRNSQRISEACRPLLGKWTDKAPGKVIDIIAILGLLLGTSTTFSVATPLISSGICALFNIQSSPLITVLILVGIAVVYTIGVIGGFKSIDIISKIAVITTSLMLALFFILGGPKFILESGLQGLGDMITNFIDRITYTDPTRVSGVAQDYTIFYWSYWIAWAVATPLFIAKISKGRTVKQLILGGLLAGLLGTFTSFIILGGTGINAQVSGSLDIMAMMEENVPAADIIIAIISTLPMPEILIVLLIISMIFLYATTFDTIAHTMASYMTKRLDLDEEPTKGAKLFWSLIFVILPIALIFSESTSQGLTAMSIIGALPLSIIFILVTISFIKDAKNYNNELQDKLLRKLDEKKSINLDVIDGSTLLVKSNNGGTKTDDNG